MNLKQTVVILMCALISLTSVAKESELSHASVIKRLSGVESSTSSNAKSAVSATKNSEFASVEKQLNRQSRVKRLNKLTPAQEQAGKQEKKSGKQKITNSKVVRDKSPEISNKNHEFSIYDARAFLLDDIDGDGFYSEFQVEFDADTVYSYAEVYAVLYLSRDGGPWEYYYTTNVFEINGSDSSDDYLVTTVLNYDYPTGEYDVLIDLYEYGYSGIVATLSADEDLDLYRLPLEDRNHETDYSSGFWFYEITTDLLTDQDGDGYYSRFAIAFDADTDYASADVFAEVYFRNEQGEWELEHSTSDFTLEGDTTLDTVHLEFEWQSGYPTDRYDFKIIIRDAYSNERLTETFAEFGALNQVPLESADRDNNAQGGGTNPPSNGSSSSHGHGGGSLPLGVIVLLMSVFLKRQRH